MAIISLKAWYVPEYEPIAALSQRPHDLRLAKNSLLKAALRADFLDESTIVRDSAWFQRYLLGDTVEFYIEGSGCYTIANIDLISHEIYFIKQDSIAQLDPTLFFCYQYPRSATSEIIYATLEQVLEALNQKARFPLKIVQSHRLSDEPISLKNSLMTRLKRSLLFIADVSPVALTDDDPPQLLLNPHVCVEVGYALHVKRPEQIFLVHIQNALTEGVFPFDLPSNQRLIAKNSQSLAQPLEEALTKQLQRLNVL